MGITTTSNIALIALKANTASLALTASYFSGSISNATSASYASTASYVDTASYALTASFFSGSISNAISASYALTASFFSGSISNATFALTASVALSSSVKQTPGLTDNCAITFVRESDTNSGLLTDSASLYYFPATEILHTTSSRAISSSRADIASRINIASDDAGSGNYEILLAEVTGVSVDVKYDSSFTFNPSTNRLSATNISSTSITGSSFTGSFTGSLFGTASWATSASQAITASYILNAISSSFATSASFASTASFFSGSVSNAISASYALSASIAATASFFSGSVSNAISASYAVTAGLAQKIEVTDLSGAGGQYEILFVDSSGSQIAYAELGNFYYIPINDTLFVDNINVSQSLTARGVSLTGSFSGSFTGSLFGTASWANNVISASFASTASFFSGSVSNATSASYASQALSSSFASTASYVLNAVSASFATNALTASFLPVGTYNITSSWSISASQAISSSFATNAANVGITNLTSSFGGPFYPMFTATNNGNGAVLVDTNLYQYAPTTNTLTVTSSYAVQALSASWAPSVASNPFPFTGSAIISGSLVITGSFDVGVPGANNPRITSVGTLNRGDIVSVDWVNRNLQDTSTLTSVDWESRILNDTSAVTSVDWSNRALYDTNSTGSVSWNERTLYDSAGSPSVDWEGRYLYDSTGNKAHSYETRDLIYPNNLSALNYGTQNQISMSGSVLVTGSLTVSGSSTFTNIGPAVFSGSVNSQGGFTGSLQGTSSYALTASFALNGGGGGAAFPFTGSALITGSLVVTGSLVASGSAHSLIATTGQLNLLASSSTVNFQTQQVGIYAPTDTIGVTDHLYLDSNSTNGGVYFSTNDEVIASYNISTGKYSYGNNNLFVSSSDNRTYSPSGFVGALIGTSSWATSASQALSSSRATSASFASTASFINTLNQNLTITGSLVIGTSSIGSTENTLVVGLPPAGGVGEGGQILLQASGGIHSSASMIDTYQDQFRILKGTNASSTTQYFGVNLHNGQVRFDRYTGSGAFTGSEAAMLGTDTNGNVLTTSLLGSTIFGNYAGTGFTNPIVTYLPFGTTAVSAAEAQRQIASPFTGLLKNVYVRTNGAAVATSFTTFIIRVNGVSTGIQINISGGQAAGLYSNTINSASVTLGAEISLQVSTSVANGPQVNQYSFGIYPS
jgi:hypothetical protein